MATTGPRIGVAISGGGFRAACFGLGALRALYDTGLLPRVSVISGISGGSILTATYAYGPKDFAEFDRTAVALLRGGLQAALLRRAFTFGAIARNSYTTARVVTSSKKAAEPRLRSANRTDALRDELAHRIFGQRTMDQVTHPGLATVVTSVDLGTSNAVRFGSLRSSSSPYGEITEKIPVADAVAASAAFPLLLPAMERRYTFAPVSGGPSTIHTVHLSDGGVYDNLGLSALQPSRSAAYTSHVYDLDYIIACDAGTGPLKPAAGHYFVARLRRSFETAHRRSQDAARSKIDEIGASGQIEGFVHAYLGMRDDRMPMPVPDLVPVDQVQHYPTDLRAMNEVDVERIAARGEQLTRALLSHYCPGLV
jgi:NTE family protein